MKTLKLLSLFLVVSLISFSSCKKEEGPQGPPGADGNANVKSKSAVVSWTYDGEFDGVYYYNAVIDASDIITPQIHSTGAIMVYGVDNNEAFALPAVFDGLLGVNFSTTSTGRVNLEYWSFEIGNPTNTAFKVVAIASSARTAQPDVDLSDYQAVKEAYNLSDDDVVSVIE